VKKGQRRLDGIDQIVLSLTARGLTTGEVAAHFADVYGASVSKDTISRITDKVLEEMTDWLHRPLDRVYPVVFVDAIVVKVRDGQVVNRPIYVAVGVTVTGERDILGLWAGDGGEGAKYWLQVLTEIKNRGVEDVCILVCDGLKGLPDSVGAVWPLTIVQTSSSTCCATRSATPGARTGTRSPKISAPSTPHQPRPPRLPGWRSSRKRGAGVTQRS
jgi:putative transposase